MNLTSIFRALRRRWWVAGLVVLMTAAGVYWVVSNARDEYQATATLLLASPEVVGSGNERDEGPDAETNPSEDAGVTLSSSVVVEIANGDAVLARLGSDGQDVDYTIVESGDGVLRVEAVSGSEGLVVDTANALINEIETVTEELDESDTQRSGDVTILSQPRFARQRTITGPDGGGQTEYYARGSVVLVIEEESAPTPKANPYTPSSGTLRIIQEASSTPSVEDDVLSSVTDERASFEVSYQRGDPVPLMYVTASATTPQATMATLDAVLSLLDEDLADRQALTGADESTWLEFQRIVLPETAQPIEVRLGRPIAAVVVLGLIAAVSLAVLIDSLASLGQDGRARSNAKAGTEIATVESRDGAAS